MVDKLRAYSVFGVILVALVLNFWFGVYTAEASSNAVFVNGQQSGAVNQTFREDRSLTNSCIEAGQSKAHCVCVTSIYKHKLTMQEYKTAVLLYKMENAKPTTILATTDISATQNISSAERTKIDSKRKALTQPNSFDAQCKDATEYFTAK